MNIRPAADTLTGTLWLSPGLSAPHSLRSTRRPLACRVTAGQNAAALPGLLASLFNLCAHAHRLCSRLAIDAAAPAFLGQHPDSPAAALRRETASEHVRRISLDWPRLLAPTGTTADASGVIQNLRACPLLNTPAKEPVDWSAVHDWLQTQWLDMAPATWLRAWRACGRDWLDDWSYRGKHWLPSLLRHVKAKDIALPLDTAPTLSLAAQPDALLELGRLLDRHGDDFVTSPRWHGRCAHTGTWSRLNDTSALRPGSAWTLLGSRIAELICLCLPQGDQWLQWGALPTGDNQGLAWVEMARGLLVHQVSLERHNDGSAHVRACQVLAPTEWNFHPEGVAAQALAGLPAHQDDTDAKAHLLMAAFDPCIPFRLDSAAAHEEVLHA
ncbi:MAG: hypothetical protein LBE78_11230 [Burkholderiaceae bacterium]|jgi:hypothetical protein|nr:hypothetical protein [Burkholderiaceae bacterium]